MFKRILNWLAGVEDDKIVDPSAYDLYPDIIPDISVEEIERRLRWDDEDNTANFFMEVEEME